MIVKRVPGKLRRRLLSLESAVLLMLAPLALRLFPLRSVRRMFRLYAMNFPSTPNFSAETIANTILSTQDRLHFHSTCLAVALTAEVLFLRSNIDFDLCVGVKVDDGEFSAHAWIERNNNVLLGGPQDIVAGYKRLPSLPS